MEPGWSRTTDSQQDHVQEDVLRGGFFRTTNRGTARRGSILAGGALFLVIFMLVGAFAVDLSRKFVKDLQLQEVADGAALTGAQSLDQFKNRPNHQKVYRSILQYIRRHQGPRYADLYQRESSDYVEGIEINSFPDPDPDVVVPCAPEFKVKNNRIHVSKPTRLTTEIIGSSVTNLHYIDEVTMRIRVRGENGNDTFIEPWGPYDDQYSGNVNYNRSKSTSLTKTPENATIDVHAKGWEGHRNVKIISTTDGSGSMSSEGKPLARVLQDGDPLPSEVRMDGGEPAVDFLHEYITSDNVVDLEENQVLVTFELTATHVDDGAYDLDDMVLLLKLNQTDSSHSAFLKQSSSDNQSAQTQSASNYCREKIYRVGVTVYDFFQPYFLPQEVFGDFLRANYAGAVAEARPLYHGEKKLVRSGQWGMLSSRPKYVKPYNARRFRDVYGITDDDPISSRRCFADEDFIRCDTTEQMVNVIDNDIKLNNQILWLDGDLVLDPRDRNAVHSLTGNGFVLVRGNVKGDNSNELIINGDLDVVSFDYQGIELKDLEGGEFFKAYLIAMQGDIEFKGHGNSLFLEGGLFADGEITTDQNQVEFEPGGFCPTSARSELCGVKKVTPVGAKPYSWEVSLVH